MYAIAVTSTPLANVTNSKITVDGNSGTAGVGEDVVFGEGLAVEVGVGEGVEVGAGVGFVVEVGAAVGVAVSAAVGLGVGVGVDSNAITIVWLL